ncbi:MAG: zinc ribbon domain-containing protein [Lachnospiraceae bacterium]|nr:zinc ribbon domain-containing protein [Lachnospiraceae bacterium]
MALLADIRHFIYREFEQDHVSSKRIGRWKKQRRIMKKFLGILFCVIGSLGTIFMILAERNKVFWVPSVGLFLTDKSQVISMTVALFLFVLVLVVGIRLLRKPKVKLPKQKKQEKMNQINYKTQQPPTGKQHHKEMSFIDQERFREWKNISRQDYVPANGPFLWKYQGRSSGGRGLALELNVSLIAIVVGVLVFCIGLVYLVQLLGNTEESMWLSTFLIFVMTGVIGYCALHVGTRANSKQLAFVRTEDGTMCFVDYRSPEFRNYYRDFQIHMAGGSTISGVMGIISYLIQSVITAENVRRIDDSQIIEYMMAENKINLCGKRIRQVKSIDKTAAGYRIYCTLCRLDGTDWHTSFLLSKSYKHFDELLYNLERLKTDHSYEQGLCHICGTRLVGGVCPSCGTVNGRKHSKTEGWYAKHEGLINILYRISGVLVILCFLGCIVTYQMNSRADYTYQKVNAIVESCEQLNDLQIASQKKPKVTMCYHGQSYQLKNVTQGSWYYRKGMKKEVFLSNGVMYANEAGVTSSGPTAMAYYGFLFGLMGLLTAFVALRLMRKEIRMQTM